MIFKLTLVFILGVFEQLLFTSYLISVDKRQKYISSLLMFIYMFLYLVLVAWAIKGSDTLIYLIDYALASAVGNCWRMGYEKK